MNEVRFRFHLAVIKFYVSIMNLLSKKCDEHNIKAEKILDELERYGAKNMTNTEYEILQDTFFQNGNMNHLEECNSVNYHAITHEDTEILGAFCDVTGFHGNDLQKLLILGYISWQGGE